MSIPTIAIVFTLSATLVVIGGVLLARSGDVIAARANLGGVWVGSVFLAVATSLPEITTDVSAVRLGAPDLAAGDLFGSSMANMVILALISLVPAGTEIFRKAALDHALYASLAMIMTAIAAVTILVRPEVSLWGVGPGSLLLLTTYVFGSRAAFVHTSLAQKALASMELAGVNVKEPDARAHSKKEPTLRRAIITFAIAAGIILVAAPQFARSAEGLAEITGVGTTFVGTWLLGFSTSLPELVTCLAAVRLRAFDLAVGNLFGSNAFNMTAFVILDAVHREGPILSVVSSVHVISALVALAMMAIALATLVYRARSKAPWIEPSSGLIIISYVMGLTLIFFEGR
jgi:cation:H+ antiporter